MPKYFDIHSHLHFSDYDPDREEVISRMKETGTATILVGTSFETSKGAVELAEKHENIYACIGIHPTTQETLSDEWSELVLNPKVVAVGECGLDFFRTAKEEDFERQKKLFLEQIDFAVRSDKPVMIHGRDAYGDILEILEGAKRVHGEKLKGNVHFFAGDKAVAERFFALGFTISFTGVITFTHDYDEVVKSAPLDKIMSETDAPWVSPAPYRGKRNEPSYVQEVVRRIAEIRGEDEEVVRDALVKNALFMIGY